MNTCNCDSPPGGSVTCPDGQIPICRVREGAAHGYCLSPPQGLDGLALTSWFFTHLLGTEVTEGEVMTRRDLQAAMEDGRFSNEETGEVITFQIPRSINMPMPAAATVSA